MSNFDLSILSLDMPLSQKVAELEKHVRAQPQEDAPSNWTHGAGIGAKTVFLKRGWLVVGAMHRFAGMSLMSKGDILLVTDGPPVRYTVVDSPVIVVSPPGTKRVALVLEDTYWTSLLPTDIDDLTIVEQRFLVPPAEQAEFIKLIGRS